MQRHLVPCVTLLALLGTSAHAAEVSGSESSFPAYEEGDPVLVMPDATVTAAASVQALRFHFDGNFDAGVDRLACIVTDPAVTCSWNEDTRALDLTGPADAATFQTVARGVAYVADGVPTNTYPRTIRFVGGALHASPRPSETGDHFFESVQAAGSLTWQEAADACATRNFDGLEGYLATAERFTDQTLISSAAPTYTTSSGTSGAYWLGASDAAVEGDWRWITGPQGLVTPGGQVFWAGGSEANGGTRVNDSFAFWSEAAPDASQPDDDHLAMDGEDGRWSDRIAQDASDPVEGYVCEYGDFGTLANVAGRVSSTSVFFDGCLGDDPEPTCAERDSDGDGLLNPVDPDPLNPCAPSVDTAACADLYENIIRVDAASTEYPVFPTFTLQFDVRRLTATLMDWSPGDPGQLTCTVTDPSVTCDWNEGTGQLTLMSLTAGAPELEAVARGITWSSEVVPTADEPVHVWFVGTNESTGRFATFPVHLGGQGHLYHAVDSAGSVYASAAFTCIIRGMTLATVESDVENAFLTRLIESNGWIGALGSAPAAGGEWLWKGSGNTAAFWRGGPASTGGAAVDGQFAAWADGEPDGTEVTSALQLRVDGLWADAALGDTPTVFLCESSNNNTLPGQEVGSLIVFDSCGADPTGLGCPEGDDDGDGVLNGDDENSLDPCVPDADGLACPSGDADGDGTPNGDDANPEDSCLPDGDAPSCPTGDADGDGVLNEQDDDSLDPCVPDADGLACPSGDADGDGTPNSDDANPEDSCLPDGDALACPTGDFDGDGVPNDIDVSTDPCLPDADVLACPTGDTDGDEVENASDADPEDPCVPNGDALACDTGDFDGDGTPNLSDIAPEDSCVPDAAALTCDEGDTDGDGTPNEDDADPEDPCSPDADALACDTGDFDGDGLSNAEEVTLGLDPTLADTDGDGINDGDEIDLGLDPKEPDTDGDGVDDDVDACPDVAGDDGAGCPLVDVPDELPDNDDKRGCATGPQVPGWWLLAVLPLLARRRRS